MAWVRKNGREEMRKRARKKQLVGAQETRGGAPTQRTGLALALALAGPGAKGDGWWW